MGVHLHSCASYGNVMRQITRSSADDAAIFAALLRTWGNVALGGTRGFIVIEETSSFRDLVYNESVESSC